MALLPADIGELKRRISKAAASVSVNMLEQVWQEMGCKRRLLYDRKDAHRVAVQFHTNFHSSSIKQIVLSSSHSKIYIFESVTFLCEDPVSIEGVCCTSHLEDSLPVCC